MAINDIKYVSIEEHREAIKKLFSDFYDRLEIILRDKARLMESIGGEGATELSTNVDALIQKMHNSQESILNNMIDKLVFWETEEKAADAKAKNVATQVRP